MGCVELICPELQIVSERPKRHCAIEPSRFAQRLPLHIPVRVCGFDSARVEFSEDIHTRMVCSSGARISLTREVYADDILRIINLNNYYEADFRVVGPTRLDGARVAEWGVEATQKGRSIWDIDFQCPPDLAGEGENGTLLECRSCGESSTRQLSLIEHEALDATGIIAASYPRCEMPTYWTYAEAVRRPGSPPPFSAVAPPPRVERVKKFVNTRAHRRLKLDLPILVRDRHGATEVARTENVSVGGFGVLLSLDLAVCDIVTYVCPFASDGQNEQQAECRWSAPASPGGTQRIYGFRRARAAALPLQRSRKAALPVCGFLAVTTRLFAFGRSDTICLSPVRQRHCLTASCSNETRLSAFGQNVPISLLNSSRFHA